MSEIGPVLNNHGAKLCRSFTDTAYGISACIHFFCGKWIPPPAVKKTNNVLR